MYLLKFYEDKFDGFKVTQPDQSRQIMVATADMLGEPVDYMRVATGPVAESAAACNIIIKDMNRI